MLAVHRKEQPMTELSENEQPEKAQPENDAAASEKKPARRKAAPKGGTPAEAVSSEQPAAATDSAAAEPVAAETVAEPTAVPTEPTPAESNSRSTSGAPRTGLIVAGFAIGALVGGVAGGGIGAVVASQLSASDASSYSRDTLTISNPDEATVVSAIAAKATPSVVTLQVTTANAAGTGSGVIIDSDGYILTNNHVVTLESGATDASIRVFLSDGRILAGTLVGTDPYSDLAVVKVDAKDLPALEFANSSKLNVGDLTVAIGAPLNLASTVTSGVISALNRGITVGSAEVESPQGETPSNPDDLWNFDFEQKQQTTVSGSITIPVIQTDASINPGNSGGALLDASGNLIGINVAIASTSSSTETAGSVGLGFAIPSNLAQRVAEALIAGKAVSHGLLGVSVGDAASAADATQSGALVQSVTSGGAAAKAGIQKGDVIVSLNGAPVMDGTSLSGLVRSYPANTEVKLGYIRDGKVQTTTVTLGSL